MLRRWFSATCALLFAILLTPAAAVPQGAPEYGPPRGTLLIVGGGDLSGSGIYEKFIELAGGRDAKFVIVPTAGGNRTADGSLKVYDEEDVLKPWKARGLTNLHMDGPSPGRIPARLPILIRSTPQARPGHAARQVEPQIGPCSAQSSVYLPEDSPRLSLVRYPRRVRHLRRPG